MINSGYALGVSDLVPISAPSGRSKASACVLTGDVILMYPCLSWRLSCFHFFVSVLHSAQFLQTHLPIHYLFLQMCLFCFKLSTVFLILTINDHICRCFFFQNVFIPIALFFSVINSLFNIFIFHFVCVISSIYSLSESDPAVCHFL